MDNLKNNHKAISIFVAICLILSIMVATPPITVSAESSISDGDSTTGSAINVELLNEDVNAAVNVSNLESIITNAQSIFDGAVEGDLPGQYPIGSKDILKAAIDNATAVFADNTATQDQIDSEAETLQAAVNVFTQSVIKLIGDLNNDHKIDIFDLYIISANLFNSDWESAKVADINHDGTINIDDLWMVVRKILYR